MHPRPAAALIALSSASPASWATVAVRAAAFTIASIRPTTGRGRLSPCGLGTRSVRRVRRPIAPPPVSTAPLVAVPTLIRSTLRADMIAGAASIAAGGWPPASPGPPVLLAPLRPPDFDLDLGCLDRHLRDYVSRIRAALLSCDVIRSRRRYLRRARRCVAGRDLELRCGHLGRSFRRRDHSILRGRRDLSFGGDLSVHLDSR